MNIKEFERTQEKTSEGKFLYVLRNSHELSPVECELILESAKRLLFRDYTLREGEISVIVVSARERSGKQIEKMEKREVRLTIDNGLEDLEVRKEFGKTTLRQVRIQRITQEAIEQEGVLSHEDLSKYFNCSLRTIHRDIKEINEQGMEVITRGVLHSIGRGQTHKSKIVGLYLDGKTYSEIKLLTHHSIGSIKRYLQSFIKVLASVKSRIQSYKEISLVTGLSEALVKQYLELYRISRKDKIRLSVMQEMISQWKRASTKPKKTLIFTGNQAFPMIGDLK